MYARMYHLCECREYGKGLQMPHTQILCVCITRGSYIMRFMTENMIIKMNVNSSQINVNIKIMTRNTAAPVTAGQYTM